MRITTRRLALVVAMAGLLGITPFLLAATSRGATSKRAALACGQTVTTSVTLTADLIACDGNGLVAGAKGITINLNGHTISGSNDNDGILDASFSSIVVRNGSIKDFNRGVMIQGGSATIQSLRVSSNVDAGIYTEEPAVITGNVVFENNGGIVVACCDSDKSTVSNNVVTANTGTGITTGQTAQGSTISGNHVLSNTGIGIVTLTDGATVSGNIANGNSTGFVVSSALQKSPLKATSNIANYNSGLGIKLGAGDTDGGGNKASGNGAQHQCENVVC